MVTHTKNNILGDASLHVFIQIFSLNVQLLSNRDMLTQRQHGTRANSGPDFVDSRRKEYWEEWADFGILKQTVQLTL